ncbi:MAG: hypothetical protein MR902_00195 [Campylobacter sp.]|nr:hypothetical protein [Campylobacter sp.]
MKKIIFCALVSLAICDCSSKEYPHDPHKNELLAYTQKFESIKGDERYLSVATYLNPSYEKFATSKSEYFLLSSYPTDINITNLKVNGKDPSVFEVLDDSDEYIKLSPFIIPWAKYYKIITPEILADNLTITYETDRSVSVRLNFVKVAKSMYWNPQIKFDDK